MRGVRKKEEDRLPRRAVGEGGWEEEKDPLWKVLEDPKEGEVMNHQEMRTGQIMPHDMLFVKFN